MNLILAPSTYLTLTPMTLLTLLYMYRERAGGRERELLTAISSNLCNHEYLVFSFNAFIVYYFSFTSIYHFSPFFKISEVQGKYCQQRNNKTGKAQQVRMNNINFNI